MTADSSFETICTAVAAMSKPEVIGRLLNFEGPIKLDFTRDYLEGLNVERLRHILLAVLINVHRKRAS